MTGQHSWSSVKNFTKLVLNLNKRNSFDPLSQFSPVSQNKKEVIKKNKRIDDIPEVFDKLFLNSLKSCIRNKRKERKLTRSWYRE